MFSRILRGIRLTSILVLASLLGSPAFAEVTIEVSSVYSAVHYAKTLHLKPGASEIVVLYDTSYKDRYIASIRVRGGAVRLVALDGRDIKANNPNPSFLLDTAVGDTEDVEIPSLPSKEGADLVFLNSHSTNPIDLRVTIFRVGQRSPAVAARIREWIETPVNSLGEFYILPNFKVSVKPCGFATAYSSPDVVICTELFADLAEKKLSRALNPILLHEMAHSLLYLWKLPGYDNEDIADDFAAAFLAKYSPEDIEAYVKWLAGNDSVSEAVVQLINGDRHTISIQRARNMKTAIASPDDLMVRWGTLLAPYRKSANMKD